MLAGQALICPQCGNLRSVCSNPDIDWHPQETYCYASGAVEWRKRKLREEYPLDVKAPDGAHALDGIIVWASDIDLESLELGANQVRHNQDDQH